MICDLQLFIISLQRIRRVRLRSCFTIWLVDTLNISFQLGMTLGCTPVPLHHPNPKTKRYVATSGEFVFLRQIVLMYLN